MTLEQAHSQAELFEADIRREIPGIQEINTHIEPTGDTSIQRLGSQTGEEQVWQILKQVAQELKVECNVHDLKVQRVAGEITISLHCTMNSAATIVDVHAVTEQVESALRARIPNLGRVLIHAEPPDELS
jgi:divalent metal cation (Fe/Co/Zn/Cd) transporter